MAKKRKKKLTRWERDDIQFPRLLSEIMAVGLTESQWDGLLAEMDLESDDLSELFDRAQAKWEKQKQRVFDGIG